VTGSRRLQAGPGGGPGDGERDGGRGGLPPVGSPASSPRREPSRHELPGLDEAAMAAARGADRLLAAATEAGLERWMTVLAPVPSHLRDDPPADLAVVARKARAIYGPKDSIRDVLPDELTLPFRDALDRLLRELARLEADRG
jgi:hypothetical protein